MGLRVIAMPCLLGGWPNVYRGGTRSLIGFKNGTPGLNRLSLRENDILPDEDLESLQH